MNHVEIICLANSHKHRGRCIAGLKVDGTGWIRPVGMLQDGTLYPPDYILDDGSEASVLDVIRVGVHSHRPAPHQPENWVIDKSPWVLTSRPMTAALCSVLCNAIVAGPVLLGNNSDRIPLALLQQQQAIASLALIKPNSVDLYHQLSYRGNPQARGQFELGDGNHTCVYDLSVTDPIWKTKIIQQGPITLQQDQRPFLLTISVGEPFGLDCYKMIAAIIELPTCVASAL